MRIKQLLLLSTLIFLCWQTSFLFAQSASATPKASRTIKGPTQTTSKPSSTSKTNKPASSIKSKGKSSLSSTGSNVKKDLFGNVEPTNQPPTFPELPMDQSLISKGPPPIAVEVAVLAGLAILPWVIMMLTSYIKIVVVISLLRNALGVQQAPPNQVVNGIALLLTVYIMFPTGLAMYDSAKSYLSENAPTKLVSSETAPYIIGALNHTKEPLRQFLNQNTAQGTLGRFYQMAYRIFPKQFRADLTRTDFIVLIPAYITSQLRDAFAIGVLIYFPFFVIDLVTSNILLAMGMMMLSPLTISLPLKLLLLVMVDGWTILLQGLVLSFK